MDAQVAFCFCALLLVGALCLPSHGAGNIMPSYQGTEVTPWPKPYSAVNGTDILAVDMSTFTITTSATSTILSNAITRTSTTIKNSLQVAPDGTNALKTTGSLVSAQIVVASSSETLDDKTDTSYTLNMTASGTQYTALITAQTVFGALYGLESLAQLMEVRVDGSYVMRGAPWNIQDKARFTHRGLLIDSSRHFLPVETIQDMIDAMSMAKLNVLHWHLVDAISFPFNSSALPKFYKGAYSVQEMYSVDDVQGVVAYAKARGVRIMVEVDTPGHSASWRFGYPEAFPNCPNTLAHNVNNGALNPANNATFDLLETLLTELGQIFPDSFFHIGGDEVSYLCWEEDPSVAAFMSQMGFGTNYQKLQQYYETRLRDIATKVLPGRSIVIYQDTFDDGVVVPKDIVFDAWKSSNPPILQELATLVKAGYRAVLANGPNSEWYLNDGFGNGDTYTFWPAVYTVEPLEGSSLTPAEQALVLGGEVSLWGEEINQNNLMEKAWPRAAAFAERMWSQRSVNDPYEAQYRLARFYCRMTARGLSASPFGPGSCYSRDSIN
eukprot:m.9815 g.9815  ORF g.9815 m.9815 type:complete len:552 (-) comp5496_c0_seq1:3325-4980(-)